MYLYNTTDDVMQHTAAGRDPIYNGKEEISFPAKLWVFKPGEKRDVPEAAAEVLLAHLGPRGLMPIAIDSDLEAVKHEGRRAWFKWCDAQRRRHISLNQSQRSKGLEMIAPNEDVVRAFRNWKRLSQTEFADEIMMDATTSSTLTPAEEAELQGTYEQNSAAARAAALGGHGEGLDVPPPV